MSVNRDFCFTIDPFVWTSNNEYTTISPMISSTSVTTMGARISITVRSGSMSMNTSDVSAILPFILEDTLR